MNPIDLIQFAEHSQRLPTSFLFHEEEIRITPSWKILVAHIIDFSLVVTASSIMRILYENSIYALFVTKNLRHFFKTIDMTSLSGPLLPIMIFSYFFFAYFMNHGQSYGMLILKNRIQMKEKSFFEAIKWASNSCLICLSCGVSFLIFKKKWQALKGHDYLYQALISLRDVQINHQSDNRPAPETKVEDWAKVA